jgi:hypothetical protein
MKYSLLQTLIYLRLHLIKSAQLGRTVPYGHLMKKYGILRGTRYGQGIGWMVGYVSEYENEHRRPLLSAIVIHSKKPSQSLPHGEPGTGFLRIDGIPSSLQRTGRDDRPLNAKEKAFIVKEQHRVWSYWKGHRRPSLPPSDLLNR